MLQQNQKKRASQAGIILRAAASNPDQNSRQISGLEPPPEAPRSPWRWGELRSILDDGGWGGGAGFKWI